MKRFESRLVVSLINFMCKIGLIKPSKVMLMDGGICSQVLQYYQGIATIPECQPEFDLSFWDRGGKDCLGNDNRSFELLDIFPNVSVKKCNKWNAILYRRYFQSTSDVSHTPV